MQAVDELELALGYLVLVLQFVIFVLQSDNRCLEKLVLLLRFQSGLMIKIFLFFLLRKARFPIKDFLAQFFLFLL